jgi:aspartyl-tRNA(Asn)/glutamyl-tRNA(Gln) amidotransferase subunit B
MAERFVRDDELPAYDAALMTQSRGIARYYQIVRERSRQAKLAANWVMGEISKRLNVEGRSIDDRDLPIDASTLGSLILRIADGTISNSGARKAFDAIWATGRGSAEDTQVLVDETIDRLGLKQMSDTGELDRILDEVLAANAKSVEEYRAGKDKAFNALIGQAMKATKGKANPAAVNELLKKKLG